MKSKVIIILCICIFIISACSSKGTITTVYSNSEDYTDIDNWLMNEVGVEATPCHIIIKDNRITNLTNYTVSYEELAKLRNNNILDIDITNKEICGQNITDYDIIIIKKENCSACKYQEEYYDQEIFTKYDNLNFLIYYIQTIECSNGCD